MKGFDRNLITMHLTLYAGYVKNTNLLINQISGLDNSGKDRSLEYGALKRIFSFEFDGMALHELYFENLGGTSPLSTKGGLYHQIRNDYGSYENWKKDFVATGLIKGIGWVILAYDHKTKKLFNTWINEHNLGHLSGTEPLLVMDVWEHAYITQYGLDRGKYIDVFFENIDWEAVETRFHKANASPYIVKTEEMAQPNL